MAVLPTDRRTAATPFAAVKTIGFLALTVQKLRSGRTLTFPGILVTALAARTLNAIAQIRLFAFPVNTLITDAAISRLQTFVTLTVRYIADTTDTITVRRTAENTAAALLVPDIAALAAGASAAVTVANIRIRHRTVRAILRSILINRTVAAAHMILIV